MKELFTKLLRRFIVSRNKTVLSKEERYAIIIFLKLIKEPSTELTAHTKKEIYYIKSSNRNMLLTFELQPNEITIINHVYCYNVKLSERSANMIYKEFIKEYEKRIQQMEYEFTNNIQHSLQQVSESLQNNDKFVL